MVVVNGVGRVGDEKRARQQHRPERGLTQPLTRTGNGLAVAPPQRAAQTRVDLRVEGFRQRQPAHERRHAFVKFGLPGERILERRVGFHVREGLAHPAVALGMGVGPAAGQGERGGDR